MDSLTFGSPVLLRHLTFSAARKLPIVEVRRSHAAGSSSSHICSSSSSVHAARRPGGQAAAGRHLWFFSLVILVDAVCTCVRGLACTQIDLRVVLQGLGVTQTEVCNYFLSSCRSKTPGSLPLTLGLRAPVCVCAWAYRARAVAVAVCFECCKFIDLCILCGCDYTASIRGIGPHRALKWIQEHRSIAAGLLHLEKKYRYVWCEQHVLFPPSFVSRSRRTSSRFTSATDERGGRPHVVARSSVPDAFPHEAAAKLFAEPLVTDAKDCRVRLPPRCRSFVVCPFSHSLVGGGRSIGGGRSVGRSVGGGRGRCS